MSEEPKKGFSTGEIVLYAGLVGLTTMITTTITMFALRKMAES